MGLIKTKKIVLVVGLLLIASGVAMFFAKDSQPRSEESALPIQENAINKEAVLSIVDGESLSKTFKADVQVGMTAFDLLEKGTKELGLELGVKNYDVGVFVESIGGVKNGEEGKYWMYYVNNALPMVAADKLEIKSGDKVEFKFEKSTF